METVKTFEECLRKFGNFLYFDKIVGEVDILEILSLE